MFTMIHNIDSSNVTYQEGTMAYQSCMQMTDVNMDLRQFMCKSYLWDVKSLVIMLEEI